MITIERCVNNKEKQLKKFYKETKLFIKEIDYNTIQKFIYEDLITIKNKKEYLEITEFDKESLKYNLKPLKYNQIIEILNSLKYNEFCKTIHILKFLLPYVENDLDIEYKNKINSFIESFNELEKIIDQIYKYKNIYNIYINNLIYINKYIYSIKLYVDKLL